MTRKRTYRKVWVKAAPLDDPALAGHEAVRMPWNPKRKIGTEPVELEETPAVLRMLHLGDLVLVEQPADKPPVKATRKDKE